MTIDNSNNAFVLDDDLYDDDFNLYDDDFDELVIKKSEPEEYNKNKKNNEVIKQAETKVKQLNNKEELKEEEEQKLLVYKSNYLVNASYKLTLNEQRIILLAISKLDSREEFCERTIQIKSNEFCERFKIKKSDFYNTINLTLDSLFNRVVRIRNDEIKHEFRFISSKKYYNNLSYFEITFSNEIMNYLIDLKDNFSRYDLKHVVNFKNKHSVRIYEMLNEFRYKNIKKRVIKIEELKECLDLKNEYSRFNSFRQSVIDKAVNEINEHTNISVKYNKIYNSNKSVEAIEFVFSFKYQDVENKTTNNYKIKKRNNVSNNRNYTKSVDLVL